VINQCTYSIAVINQCTYCVVNGANALCTEKVGFVGRNKRKAAAHARDCEYGAPHESVQRHNRSGRDDLIDEVWECEVDWYTSASDDHESRPSADDVWQRCRYEM
jgi:hypothetical protein